MPKFLFSHERAGFEFAQMVRRGKILCVTCLFIVTTFFGCDRAPERADEILTGSDVAAFLDRLEKQYEASCIRMGQANWDLSSGERPADLVAVRAEFAEMLHDSLNRKIISTWRYTPTTEVGPNLKRRLEIWTQCLLGAFVEEDEEIYTLERLLEERNRRFTFSFEGKEISRAELNRIVRTDPDQEKRRRAWEAFGSLSQANERDLLRLLHMRNEKVSPVRKQLDYGIFSLMTQSINAGWLENLITKLEEQTREPYRQFVHSVKEDLGIKILRPWDIQYAMHQIASLPDEYFPQDRALPSLFEFLTAIGFRVKKLPIRITEGDSPYDVFGVTIEIPKRVKLLVGPGHGHRYYSQLFHEYGRGLYAVHIQTEQPIFKGYEWVLGATSSAYTEGMAEVMAEFVRDPLWLKTYTNLPEERIELYTGTRSQLELYSIRSTMSTISFELQAYKNVDQNLDFLQRETDEKFLLVDIPDDTPSRWASMTSLVSYPVNYQNYLLAAVVAAQVHQALKEQFGDQFVKSPEVGPWLIENLYAPGESIPWRERIRNATGKWPDIDAYVEGLIRSGD